MGKELEPLTAILAEIVDLPEGQGAHINGGLYVFNVPGDGPHIRDRATARKVVRPKLSYALPFELRSLIGGTFQATDPNRRFQVQFSREADARWELVMQDPNPDMQATAGFNNPYLRLNLRDFQPYGEARIYTLHQYVSRSSSPEVGWTGLGPK